MKNALGEQHEIVRRLWIKTCEYDEIDPKEKFVIFSKENPFVEEYNKAMGVLLRGIRSKKGEQ